MKKSLIGMMAGVALLSGCATTDGNLLTDVGKSIFIQAVDNKCRSELNANSIYKTASVFLTSEQKSSLENKVCGCVAEEAPNSITLSEMGQAVIDSSARPQIVAKAVTHTLGTCIQKMVL